MDGPLRPSLSLLGSAVADAIDALRADPPKIHALMAPVAQPLSANIAAALAIDVSMTVDADDAVPMAKSADAVLINLGMADAARGESSVALASLGVPAVLDPVKVDRAPGRLALARRIAAGNIAIIKGNAGEMAALCDTPGAVRVTTGAIDHVAQNGVGMEVDVGTPLLDRVIATGCASGLLMAALLPQAASPFVAAIAGVSLMGVAGAVAADGAPGPGTFAVRLIDALAALDGQRVAERVDLP
ncbi:MAG: hydroxyethylthiazole kinase [Pseudomonadota bacterium]